MSWTFYSKEGKLLYDVVAGSAGDADTLDGIDSTGFVRIGAPGLNSGDVDLDGSLTLPINTVSSNTTLNSTHRTVLVNSSAGAVDITLPATPLSGQVYEVKDYGASGAGSSSTNAITIVRGDSGHRINGLLSDFVINEDGRGFILVFDGSNWVVLSDFAVSVNADQLDSLDSTQFLRSDDDDTATGKITFDDTVTFNAANFSPVIYKNEPYTLTTFDRTVLADPDGAALTITLPVTHSSGQWYEIRDIGDGGIGSSSTYPIIINRNGSTIDGLASDVVLNFNSDSIVLVSNGVSWYTISRKYPQVMPPISLNSLSDVLVTPTEDGELLRYDLGSDQWVNVPGVLVDSSGRLVITGSGSGSGMLIGTNLGVGNEARLYLQTAKTLTISGRTIHEGTSNTIVKLLENGVLPVVGDTYEISLPEDNTLMCYPSSGDLYIRIPSYLNPEGSISGDRVLVKDAQGLASSNTLAVVSEGVRGRLLPLLSVTSADPGISDTSSTITPGGSGVDEVQLFQVSGSGNFKVTFDGEEATAILDETSNAATVEAAINSLSPHPNYGYFSVSVSGTDVLTGLSVTFDGGTLIDGEAFYYINVDWQCIEFIAQGGNWYII